MVKGSMVQRGLLYGRSNTSVALASAARCQCGPSGWQSSRLPRWRRGAADIQLQITPSPLCRMIFATSRVLVTNLLLSIVLPLHISHLRNCFGMRGGHAAWPKSKIGEVFAQV